MHKKRAGERLGQSPRKMPSFSEKDAYFLGENGKESSREGKCKNIQLNIHVSFGIISTSATKEVRDSLNTKNPHKAFSALWGFVIIVVYILVGSGGAP